MDFVFGLPPDNKRRTGIVVFVDGFSKMVHLAAVPAEVTAKQTTRLFVDMVFRHHGMPIDIVSDRVPRFTARFWQEGFTLLGTQLVMSTAGHPPTDGQTERVNRVLVDGLKSYTHSFRHRSDCLPMAEFAINNPVHVSTGHALFYVNAMRHPRVPSVLPVSTRARTTRGPIEESTVSTPGVDTVNINEQHTEAGPVVNKDAELNTEFSSKAMDFVQRRQTDIRFVQDVIAASIDRQKLNADNNGRGNTNEFKVGSLVLLATQNLAKHAQSSSNADPPSRVAPKKRGKGGKSGQAKIKANGKAKRKRGGPIKRGTSPHAKTKHTISYKSKARSTKSRRPPVKKTLKKGEEVVTDNGEIPGNDSAVEAANGVLQKVKISDSTTTSTQGKRNAVRKTSGMQSTTGGSEGGALLERCSNNEIDSADDGRCGSDVGSDADGDEPNPKPKEVYFTPAKDFMEVLNVRSYAADHGYVSERYEVVTSDLNEHWKTDLCARTVKERFFRLVKEFKATDCAYRKNQALKRNIQTTSACSKMLLMLKSVEAKKKKKKKKADQQAKSDRLDFIYDNYIYPWQRIPGRKGLTTAQDNAATVEYIAKQSKCHEDEYQLFREELRFKQTKAKMEEANWKEEFKFRKHEAEANATKWSEEVDLCRSDMELRREELELLKYQLNLPPILNRSTQANV
ncbi:unnamed protein product [Phytophthora fragariaefolia]|uniref:Unnamed protein product n=1 Tax=Phytophthora fragariaefolia TaxID=1490495 RepID=A0A9W6XMB3_9STRA|nr:unnamed protein product [Phytophthora fragariaefolia]